MLFISAIFFPVMPVVFLSGISTAGTGADIYPGFQFRSTHEPDEPSFLSLGITQNYN